jgi:autotransporter-associated beta strand protein
VKFVNGENVTFDDTSNNAQPIVLNSTINPGSLTVNASNNNYTITGTGSIAGAGALRLLPGNTSTFTLATVNTYTGGTIVSGGRLIAAVQNALPIGGALTINTGAAVQIAPHTTSTTGSYHYSQQFSPLTLNGTGLLDLTDNAIAINYGSGTDPVANIRQALISGYTNGIWNGPGINSSAVAENRGTSIGYLDNGSQIVAKFTWIGDTNLDGVVNDTDLLAMAPSGVSNETWSMGDFNYDGIVNADDYALFQLGAAISSGQNIAVVLPEPACIGLFCLAVFPIRRRRKQSTI